jgi:hypothetical protein
MVFGFGQEVEYRARSLNMNPTPLWVIRPGGQRLPTVGHGTR